MDYTVLLECDTVGVLTADKAPDVGAHVKVKLRDKNGSPIEVEGKVKDVLEIQLGGVGY
ncbi:hypothetical protein ACP6H1_27410 [Vibrio harveyi]|uniref:hypothetical protein n=1 Tax=Vibrio harveyi TaxID=669 RepID=UPI003CE807F6